jgi:hypothetical protein
MDKNSPCPKNPNGPPNGCIRYQYEKWGHPSEIFYGWIDPKNEYSGGATYQYQSDGDPMGWVALRWNPKVQDRFAKLAQALAKKFDGEIEGIWLEETAVEITEDQVKPAPGFTYSGYRDGILANMGAFRSAFKKSVVMQSANFMPGEWLPGLDKGYLKSIFEFAIAKCMGVSGPDLMPKNKGQQNHTYHFMNQYKRQLTLGIGVEDGNYAGETGHESPPKTPVWPDPVPGLIDYARNTLGVNYMFWTSEEPYFCKNVLPDFGYQMPAHPVGLCKE